MDKSRELEPVARPWRIRLSRKMSMFHSYRLGSAYHSVKSTGLSGRCAAAAAVDRWGEIYVVGGWNGRVTCRSGEVLSHVGDSNVPAAWRYNCPPRLPPSWYLARHEGRASRSGLDVMGHDTDSSSPCRPESYGDSPGDDGGAATEFSACEAKLSQGPGAPETRGMGLKEARRWSTLPRMLRPRCFLGAVFEPGGGLVAVGGGTGLYTNATAFDTVEVLRPGKALNSRDSYEGLLRLGGDRRRCRTL